jgi:hypothetical protein
LEPIRVGQNPLENTGRTFHKETKGKEKPYKIGLDIKIQND